MGLAVRVGVCPAWWPGSRVARANAAVGALRASARLAPPRSTPQLSVYGHCNPPPRPQTSTGKKMTECLTEQGIVPGIKVDKGLVPLANSNGESWCMGLDGLDGRCAEYYKAGARFAKWRSVVSIPAGPSLIALRDCAYGLARYAAIAQNAGLVPIVEPEVLLDGEQDIDQ
jgi:hypothetical protein